MTTQKLDSERRIVLPEGNPGDIFEIRPQGEGRFLLVRQSAPRAAKKMTREECIKAIEENPIELTMTWEELRRITREP